MAKKRSTYADVDLSALPRKQPEDLGRQAQIDLEKAKLVDLSTFDLAEKYARMRREYDAIKAEQEALWLRVESVQQMLIDSQERQDPEWGQYGVEDNALRLPNGDTIRVDKLPSAKVVDKAKFHAWVRANGYADKFDIHHGTMESWVKERLKSGEAVPDGTEATHYAKMVFTEGRS